MVEIRRKLHERRVPSWRIAAGAAIYAGAAAHLLRLVS
jgi:hypothetical protein